MTTIRLPRRVLAAVGLSCAIAIAAPTAAVARPADAVAATPASNTTWAVAPSSSKGNDGRTHFSYSGIKPGSVIHDYVGITNYSDKPVTFQVYASDGITTSAGSIGLAPSKQRPVDIGAWLHTLHSSVTVPAKRELNEPFTLTVPANATPGDHVGGVVASLVQGGPGQVTRENRVGVAFYLRVTGLLHPILGVEGLTISGYDGTVNPFGGGDTTVSYTVHNTGNVRLGGNQTISVTGPFGITVATAHPAPLEEVLPGDSVRVTAHVTGIFPLGPMTVHASVAPQELPGSVHVTVPITGGSQDGSMWATPWPQLVLLVLLVAVGIGILLFLRRRRRGHAAALRAAVEKGRREATEQLAAVGGRPEHETPEETPSPDQE